jgi:hypothetical protein
MPNNQIWRWFWMCPLHASTKLVVENWTESFFLCLFFSFGNLFFPFSFPTQLKWFGREQNMMIGLQFLAANLELKLLIAQNITSTILESPLMLHCAKTIFTDFIQAYLLQYAFHPSFHLCKQTPCLGTTLVSRLTYHPSYSFSITIFFFFYFISHFKAHLKLPLFRVCIFAVIRIGIFLDNLIGKCKRSPTH